MKNIPASYFFLTRKGKKAVKPLYYIENVVDKEKIFLPSSYHLLSSVKAIDYETIFNHPRFDSQNILEGRFVLWNGDTSLLID